MRNLVGKIFPYAAVMQSSGCNALRLDKNVSYRKIEAHEFSVNNSSLIPKKSVKFNDNDKDKLLNREDKLVKIFLICLVTIVSICQCNALTSMVFQMIKSIIFTMSTAQLNCRKQYL